MEYESDGIMYRESEVSPTTGRYPRRNRHNGKNQAFWLAEIHDFYWIDILGKLYRFKTAVLVHNSICEIFGRLNSDKILYLQPLFRIIANLS